LAGYSAGCRDERKPLRRLASYRLVLTTYRQNAAGGFQHCRRAVLADFQAQSKRALRDRHPGKPADSQHGLSAEPADELSIGITIGDVVERDGDLLGDGVNIAARLERAGEVGGICISARCMNRSQQVVGAVRRYRRAEWKNIPRRCCLYGPRCGARTALRDAAGQEPVKPATAPNGCGGRGHAGVVWPPIGVGGFLYFTKLENAAPKVSSASPSAGKESSPAPSHRRSPRLPQSRTDQGRAIAPPAPLPPSRDGVSNENSWPRAVPFHSAIARAACLQANMCRPPTSRRSRSPRGFSASVNRTAE